MRAGHHHTRQSRPSWWRSTLAAMMVLLMVLWMAGEGEGLGLGVAEGDAGPHEERMTVEHVNSNSAGDKRETRPPVCIATTNTGVVPCDDDPRCCQQNSPRVKGTDYCCPPGAYQYSFKSGNNDICACAINPTPSEV